MRAASPHRPDSRIVPWRGHSVSVTLRHASALCLPRSNWILITPLCTIVVLRCVCTTASKRGGAQECGIVQLVKAIGVCGRKGGSGKTTTAVHLAAELSSRGRKVTLVDCDPQGSATHWSRPGNLPMEVQHRPVSAGDDIRSWSRTINSLAVEFLVLDSPPHLDVALGGVIGLSDVAVLPCGPSGLDLIATAQTIKLVREIRAARGDGHPKITLVPNRLDLRTSSGRQLVSALEALGEDVTPSVHSRTALADSFNLGEWVGAFAPGSPAHSEVIAVTDHILKLLGEKPRKRKA